MLPIERAYGKIGGGFDRLVNDTSALAHHIPDGMGFSILSADRHFEPTISLPLLSHLSQILCFSPHVKF